MPHPNFLIIGAPRSGTTSLHEWLKQHPDVFMSERKEPNFFVADEGVALPALPSADPAVRAWDEYVRLFQSATTERVIGESSVMYLQTQSAPARIKARLGQIKMVAVLRDPADRAFSNFVLHRMIGSEPIESFRAAIESYSERAGAGWRVNWDYVTPGFYARHLENYERVFGKAAVKVVLFDDLASQPAEVMRSIACFLGVSKSFAFDTTKVHNASAVPLEGNLPRRVAESMHKLEVVWRFVPPALRRKVARRVKAAVLYKPKIAPEERVYLIDMYAPDIRRLEQMIGRDLTGWRTV